MRRLLHGKAALHYEEQTADDQHHDLLTQIIRHYEFAGNNMKADVLRSNSF